MNPLYFLEPQRSSEVELHVERCTRVVRKLVRPVLMELKSIPSQAELPVPPHALALPVVEPLHVGSGLDKELHLHLLELARSKDEVAGSDFVSECLSNLSDSKRDPLSSRLLNVQKIDVGALRRFRTKIDGRRAVLDRTHERPEHEIELPRLAECSFHSARRTLCIGSAGHSLYLRIVSSESLPAIPAVDQRVNEPTYVAAGFPHARVHQDR